MPLKFGTSFNTCWFITLDQNLVFSSEIGNTKGLGEKATLSISQQARTAGVPIFRGK